MDLQLIPDIGARWDNGSLLWSGRGGQGALWEQRSPIDQSLIQAVSLLAPEELDALAAPNASLPGLDQAEFQAFCLRLSASLEMHAPLLEEAMLLETGFVRADCWEMMSGSLCYVRDFLSTVSGVQASLVRPIAYEALSGKRRIRCAVAPWGTVAVVLPQNAFLLVALTCLLNALYTGNRVILRAPQQSARSAALLATVVEQAGPPAGAVSVVLTRAKDFLEALYRTDAPCLIHYMGSSAHAPDIMAQAFHSRKGVVIDGQGNGWVYVADDACLETAAAVLTQGAIRYNGQTCTSVNGAIIAPALFPLLRERLLAVWGGLRAGNPITQEAAVGPLFDDMQAQSCLELIEASGGKILCGGQRDGNLLAPTLIETPLPRSGLVTHGVFGCALWITPGTEEDFASWWTHNQYPLCAGVLSPSAHHSAWQSRLSNLARLTVNGDPSIEYLFEPWGGYAASGSNPVSLWMNKYQRIVQVDEPAKKLYRKFGFLPKIWAWNSHPAPEKPTQPT